MSARVGRYQQKKLGAPRTPSTKVVWCPLCYCKFCICSGATLERVTRELQRAITQPMTDPAVEAAFRRATDLGEVG